MDHLSFVFSLLLIVPVITTSFGSVIKAKNPNGEEIEALLSDAGLDHYPEMIPNRQELEALLKQSHDTEAKLQGQKSFRDQGSEMHQRVAAGIIIEGITLTVNLLNTLLETLANVDRKVAIGIDNESTLKWQQPSTYFSSGTADENLPYSVENGKAVLYGPRKTDAPTATGAVGVLSYYIAGMDKTLAVMWSVPFDYNLYENWWNVKLYDGNKRPDKEVYEDLYYDADPFRANGWHERDLGRDSDLKFRGSMSSSAKATLEIHVLKK